MFILAPLAALTASEAMAWIGVGSAAVAVADKAVDVVKKATHIFDDDDDDDEDDE